LRRLFSSSGGNHQEKVAEGHLDRFPRLRQFPQASPSARSFFLLLFLSCENPHLLAESFRARIAYKRRSTAGAAWSMAGFLPRGLLQTP